MISTSAPTSVFAPLKPAERRTLRSPAPKSKAKTLSRSQSQSRPCPPPATVPLAPKAYNRQNRSEEVDYAPLLGFQSLGCKLLSLQDAQARRQPQQPEVDWASYCGLQALGCKILSLEDAQKRHARYLLRHLARAAEDHGRLSPPDWEGGFVELGLTTTTGDSEDRQRQV
ncbi:hypothetical protein BV20DRAFT_981224 [Pilatotrama ljubarskyi]|nr:hypothetical protein BV20DRAFT_981224 [Pilatotrama ljubarskyi]